MRASRLLSILILLQLRGRLSAEMLAREFEVSVRTIYRDIEHLSAAGVPVYAERGRSGGFALMDGYRTRLTGFTTAEAEALALVGLGAAASDLGLGAAATAAQLKLLASLPPDSGATAQTVSSRFHLDPAPWYTRTEPLDVLPALARAVWREAPIRIAYESWKTRVQRDLAPLGLVLKGGVWYLVAAADGQPRTYRVSGIASLDVCEGSFVRPKGFNLARYWSASARDFERRLLRDRATVKLSPEGRRLLREVSPTAAAAVDSAHRCCRPAGWVRTEIPVEATPYGVRQLLQLGAEIEVLAPDALRSAVAAEARRIAGRYRVPARGGVKPRHG